MTICKTGIERAEIPFKDDIGAGMDVHPLSEGI